MNEEELKAAQEALSHVREMKEKFDEGLITESQLKEYSEKAHAALDKQEELSQKATSQMIEAQKELEEMKERTDKLEKHLMHSSKGEVKRMKDSAEYKALNTFITHGDIKSLEALEQKTNRTDIITDGGALVPILMFDEIIKNITEISPMRQLARVSQIDGKAIELPVRTSLLTASYEGETEESTESNSGYGAETFTPYAQTVTVPVTMEMLMNSAFDFENEVMMDAVEAFADGEGFQFINGDGVKKPEGILTNAGVLAGARTSAASGTISIDDTINLSGDLKAGYNGMYTFNRATNAFLRTLKGTDGHYLWQLQGSGEMNTLNGFNYMIDQELPNIASGAIPVLFGDFSRGYRIVDRTAMTVIRDDYTQKKKRIVELQFTRWNTGKVQQAEAIRALIVAA